MQKVNFQGFRAQLVVSQEAAVFFCRILLEKTDGIEIQGFSRKASNGGTARLNETIRNELFQLQKVHF